MICTSPETKRYHKIKPEDMSPEEEQSSVPNQVRFLCIMPVGSKQWEINLWNQRGTKEEDKMRSAQTES